MALSKLVPSDGEGTVSAIDIFIGRILEFGNMSVG